MHTYLHFACCFFWAIVVRRVLTKVASPDDAYRPRKDELGRIPHLCVSEKQFASHHAKVRLPRELQIHHSNMKSVCQGARQSACTPVPYPYNALVAHCGRRFHVFSHLVLTQ